MPIYGSINDAVSGVSGRNTGLSIKLVYFERPLQVVEFLTWKRDSEMLHSEQHFNCSHSLE